MKKVLALAFCFLLSTLAATAAPNRANKGEIGLNGIGVSYNDSDISAAAGFGGSFSYGINRNLAIGVSGDWSRSNLDAHTATGTKIEGAKVKSIPVLFDIILRPFADDGPFGLYGTLGLGLLVDDIDGRGTLTDNNLKADRNNDFALNLGGGAEWFVTENWAYYLEASYLFTGAAVDISNSANNNKIESHGLDAWYFGVGIKYLFT